MKKLITTTLLITCSVFFFSGQVFSQKPVVNRNLEIIAADQMQTYILGNKRIEVPTGKPVAVYFPDYPVTPSSPEKMALQYLAENAVMLKIDLSHIEYVKTFETPAAYHVHFQQVIDGYPVFNSDINVTVSKYNHVVFLMNGYRIAYGTKTHFEVKPFNVSAQDALLKAKNYLGVNTETVFEKSETVIHYLNGKFRLAQKVNLVPSTGIYGDWEIFVDAFTGEIFSAEDKACYNHGEGNKGKQTVTAVDGSGWVFDPDPITHATTTYGSPGFSDNNDADSDSLTAHLETRILPDITFNGSVYSLVSPWAEIKDFEAPFTGLHTNPTSDFHFTRSHDTFEAVNTFFHIDQSMRYINLDLGIPLMPYQYTTGVKFDPHGLNGDDNSHYITSTGSLAFGDGGVDDAEDFMVVTHELGHGIHDWVTSGGLSQVEGLSEGCGDYWAASYLRSTAYWTPANPAYNWVFIWDGHNPFWDGRITNYTAHYPEGLTGQIHTDGQMWSSSLMSIYDLIGREPTDRNFLEGLAMTNGSSGQVDAANAFIVSDQINYGGIHIQDITDVFMARGYITGPVTVDFSADVTGGQPPLTVHFTDLSFSTMGDIISWDWDLDGDGNTDSNEQNPVWVYTQGGSYDVKLTVSDGTNQASLTKENYISVNSGVFVWEGQANDPNYSGAFIRDYFSAQGYEVVYSSGADLPSSLSGFDAAFLSFGNWGSGGSTYTELTDENADIIIAYLQAGGKVYLEGGDSFGFNQSGNTTLLNLFGLASASDGSSSQTPVTNLQGQSAAITNGMLFTGSTQPQNTYIDIYTPNANGTLAFTESTVGNVAVQSAQGNARTFCFSYALAGLINGSSPSTKEELLDKLIEFFDIPIPVELISFNAQVSFNNVELNWETASELNNSGFEVQKKEAGIGNQDSEWENIGFVPGFGTSTEKHSYSFVDKNLSAGSIYQYRLKQMDFDGSYEFSDIIEVEINQPVKFSLEQNYPNPFNPATTISYSIAEDAFVQIKIFNMLGQQVAAPVSTKQSAGIYNVVFNADVLSSGTYLYSIEADYGNGKTYKSVKKMMVLK